MIDLLAPLALITGCGLTCLWWLRRANQRLQRAAAASRHPSARTSLDMLLVQCACRRPQVVGVHSEQWCEWDDAVQVIW